MKPRTFSAFQVLQKDFVNAYKLSSGWHGYRVNGLTTTYCSSAAVTVNVLLE
jgi:hypothetical protein